jgi:hypothetical protein
MKNRTIKKTLFLLLPLVLIPVFALGQPSPPSDQAMPGLGLVLTTDGSISGKGGLKSGSNLYPDVQINNGSFNLSQIVGLGEERLIVVNLASNRTWINTDHTGVQQAPLPDKLQSLGLSANYSTKLNDRWALSSFLSATSSVANQGLLSKGWGVDVQVMGLYTWSPNLTFAIGLAYDSASEDWQCVPMLGLEWRPKPKWTFTIGFPMTAVSYDVAANLKLSFAFSGAGGTYFVKDDPRPGVAPSSLANSKLEYAEARLGFQAEWKLSPAFGVSGGIGYVVYREFKYIDRNYRLKLNDTVPFVTLAASLGF